MKRAEAIGLPHDNGSERMSEVIEVLKVGWVTARGDQNRVDVARSPLVKQRHRCYQPVREHIARHGLVLAARETRADPDFMHGEVETSVYVTPQTRNAGIA